MRMDPDREPQSVSSWGLVRSDDVAVSVQNALASQVGGDHYSKLAIQPVDYIHKNNLGFIEGCIIKYATRHRDKGKAQDVRKIIHFAELLLRLEYGEH